MMNDALAFASGVVHFLKFIYLFSKVGAALEEQYGYPIFGPSHPKLGGHGLIYCQKEQGF